MAAKSSKKVTLSPGSKAFEAIQEAKAQQQSVSCETLVQVQPGTALIVAGPVVDLSPPRATLPSKDASRELPSKPIPSEKEKVWHKVTLPKGSYKPSASGYVYTPKWEGKQRWFKLSMLKDYGLTEEGLIYIIAEQASLKARGFIGTIIPSE